MPVFDPTNKHVPEYTQVTKLAELKIPGNPIEDALNTKKFLMNMTTFVACAGMPEDLAVEIFLMKVGPNMCHIMEHFQMKWQAVATGDMPYFLPAASLEMFFILPVLPWLAKAQLSEKQYDPNLTL